MDPNDLPPDYIAKLRAVKAMRPKRVIDEILEHGMVTTEELKDMGYNHPPRAARDVRELGIVLETIRVRDTTGRSIGAYVFADPATVVGGRLAGRQTFPKELKDQLIERDGAACGYCGAIYAPRYLQIDHRVPFEVSGDDGSLDPELFMLLCASCQRSKSWSCENCPNLVDKVLETCESCIWAHPDDYEHVATKAERRVTVVWSEDVEPYEKLRAAAESSGQTVAERARDLLS